ncbi:MAG: hypothetical protein IJ002_02650 [Clostridia bacterium]|nr:hypothetical protein [Clostridia bacterium]
MKTNKRIAVCLFSVMLVACALFGLVACGNDECEHNWQEATCTAPKTCTLCSETEGEVAAHAWVDATCTEAKHCANCSATEGEALGHSGGTATCSQKAKCSVCGTEYGELASHVWVDATCTEPKHCENCTATEGEALGHSGGTATCTQKAKCSTCGTEYGDLADHVHDQAVVKTEALKSAASCKSAAVYYKSCACGHVSESDTESFTNGEALPHSHVEVGSTDATCEEPATKTYRCACGDEYTDKIGDALEHDTKDVKPTEKAVSGSSCEYVLVYVCARENCGKEVEGEHVYHHSYVASITKAATCKEDGVKTLKCSCGDTETETIKKDSTGHNWVKGTEADGTRTDTCSHCGETKKVTVLTGATNADSLKGTEVQISGSDQKDDISLKLDDGVIDAIKQETKEDISISAGTVDNKTLEGLGLTKDQLDQIGNSPVYDFTISYGKGDKISTFGDNNYITVTLPYELAEGEDVDSIAIWFINDKGEPESIEATYNNGYVTFKTNHFSYYTVTRLTPAERCALYGCSFTVQTVKGSCIKDGYDLYVCVRCHKSEKKNIKVADGHDYTPETHAATCTEDGYILYACGDCEHSYKIKLKASGHSFSVEDSKDATCTANGYVKYGCSNCDAEYSEISKKADHIYKDTVVPATCEAGGYTLHECENCDHSYTDAQTEALGHAYAEPQWTWSDDRSSATLTLVCERNEAHSTVLNATVDKTVTTGTCSDFVKTTYTATVSHNGETYTDVKVSEVGTPDHNFSDDWKKDENEHWHECVCGEKTDVGTHTFENATVTKEPTCSEEGESTSSCACGAKKVTSVPATGKHTYVDGKCSVCGAEKKDDLYVNLINSWKEIDGFAIRIENFSYEIKEKDTSLLEQWKLIGSVRQLDVAELTLYMEDGELHGAATGNIILYNNPIPNANAAYSFKALIEDGNVYINAYHGKNTADNQIKMKYTVEYLLDELFSEVDLDTESAKALGDLFENTLSPALDTLIANDPEKANEIIGNCFNMIFVIEAQENGTYLARLDYDKLLKLNDDLATRPVAEVIDIYFGEGAFDSLEDLARELLDLKMSEIPEYLEDKGLNADELIEDFNEYAISMGESEDFDIGDFIYGEEYADFTLGMLIFETEDESYSENLDEIFKVLREETLYAMLDVTNVEEFKNGIKELVEAVSESATVSFTTNSNGTLSSIGVKADGLYYEEDGESLSLTFDLTVVMNGDIEVSWTDIVDDIESSIVKPKDDMLTDDTSDSAERRSGTMTYKGVEYYYDGYITKYFRTNYDRLLGIIIEKDCNGWMSYSATYAKEYYGYKAYMLYSEDDRENIVYRLLIDEATGDTVELTNNNGVWLLTYADGTVKAVSEEGLSNEAALYTETFGEPRYTDSSRKTYFTYYYNETENIYSVETHHSLKYEYDVVGDYCHEDGCIVTVTCEHCDYLSERRSYGCDYEYEARIDLSEYSPCGGYIIADRCRRCGYVSYVYNMNAGCNLNDGEEEHILDANGNEVGHKYTYTCIDCGLVFVQQEWTEQHSTCQFSEHEDMYIFKGDERIFAYEREVWRSSHTYEYTYEMNGTTCEEGYKAIQRCTACGDTNIYNRSGHWTESIRFDLAQVGLCGGYVEQNVCRVCKKVTYSYCRDYDCSWYYAGDGENGVRIYRCDKCGATKHQYTVTGEKDANCQYIVTNVSIYIVNGKEVYRCESSSTYVQHSYKHDFKMHGDTCEDGYTVFYACSDCGYSYESDRRTYHESFRLFELNMSEIGCCEEHYLRVYGCPCGYSSSCDFDMYNFNFDKKLGTYVCETCGLTVKNNTVRTEDGCTLTKKTTVTVELSGAVLYSYEKEMTYVKHSFTDISVAMVDGEVVVSAVCDGCGVARSDELAEDALCEHSYTSFGILLDGAKSCEDGIIQGDICTSCGRIHDIHESNAHEYVKEDTVSLEKYACYGEFSYSSCACGEVSCINYYSCAYQTTRNEYYDEENRLITVEVQTCPKCGLRYTNSYYTVKDKEACTLTYYYTVTLQMDTELIYTVEYVSVKESHDFEVSGTLMGGKGSSCEDGVTVTYTCKDCGYSYSNEIHQHDLFETERIELSKYGSVCGGYATVESCFCGEITDLYYDHILCDLSYKKCEIWIEDAIEGQQYNTNGYNWYSYDAYIYTCAVTEPACGYKIRYALYWLKASDECKAYQYETWQFGYDEETGEYKYEITFRTGESRAYHDYTYTSTDNSSAYDCADCGSYYHINKYYNTDGKLIKEQTIAESTVSGSNKYFERTYEYAFDSNGDRYTIREYSKTVYADGSFNESSKTNKPYTGSFGENGIEYSYIVSTDKGVKYTEQNAYVYYKGNQYYTYRYILKGGDWERYDYSYTFGDECIKTTVYANSDGAKTTNTTNCCKFNTEVTVTSPTCTQDGTAYYKCDACENKSDLRTLSARDHKWVRISGTTHFCYDCGLVNSNGASGELILEDLTESYGDGENYVVGYYSLSGLEFTYYVSLVLADGKEVVLDGVNFADHDELRAIVFSKADVEALATKAGCTSDQYEVKFSAVPYGSNGSFDYAVTFGETDNIGAIVGKASFTDYVGAGETVSYTITPTEDALWSIRTYGEYWRYCALYDENDSLIIENEGSIANVKYELKAGETYTLKVRWSGESSVGYMYLLFT